jgi:hypothetical protein
MPGAKKIDKTKKTKKIGSGKGGKRKGAGRPKGNGRVVITARIEPELRDALKAKAAQSGGAHTVNSLIESFIKAGLRQ